MPQLGTVGDDGGGAAPQVIETLPFTCCTWKFAQAPSVYVIVAAPAADASSAKVDAPSAPSNIRGGAMKPLLGFEIPVRGPTRPLFGWPPAAFCVRYSSLQKLYQWNICIAARAEHSFCGLRATRRAFFRRRRRFGVPLEGTERRKSAATRHDPPAGVTKGRFCAKS
jgi:hypothetical protein